MKNKLKVIRNMGISWTLFRAQYELKRKTGILKKKFTPKWKSNSKFINNHINLNMINDHSLKSYIQTNKEAFFANQEIRKKLQEILSEDEQLKIINRGNQRTKDVYLYFSKQKYPYKEINWHYSPFTNKKSPKNKHWLDISDLNSDFGDIKFIWELSRFPFVYDLVRAYILKQDDKYVVKFWELIEDWIEKNPSEFGVNYKCGQEMSLRVMAWLFGLYSFIDHPETTSERVTTLLKIIYSHIDHVDKHFDFALKSVRNNHTISEAAGMYSIGLLFPFFDKSKKWKKKGKKHLESEAQWQIYEDGSYIQNSMNYHRLMIQVYTWVLRLAELNGDTFSNNLIKRLRGSIIFLYQHQISSNGRLPNYGMNDGALIFPLSTCDYLDYRPQLNAAWMAVTGNRLYKQGKYDEEILWLFGSKALNKRVDHIKKESNKFIKGGYFTFNGENSFGMTRCTTFKHRPAQADMLHFDLWMNDVNVLCDAGTYSYNTAQEFMSYFNGTSSHNTIMIDEKDQMKKGSRFIWLDWTKSKLIRYEHKNGYNLFEGEHYGYNPLTHRRGILNINDNWIIIDDVFGDFKNEQHSLQLSWLFGVESINKSSENEWKFRAGERDYKMNILADEMKSILYYGNEEPFRGWQSLYYGNKQKRPQLVISKNSNRSTRFVTIISDDPCDLKVDNDKVQINSKVVKLLPIGTKYIFGNIKEG